jgi:hypothetical protein
MRSNSRAYDCQGWWPGVHLTRAGNSIARHEEKTECFERDRLGALHCVVVTL